MAEGGIGTPGRHESLTAAVPPANAAFVTGEALYAMSGDAFIAYEVVGEGNRHLLIELRDDDIAGIAVHIAARVAALAEPSSVWVSRTVTDLVIGSSIRFRDRGEHRLKGVPGTWALFTVADE